MRNWYRDYITEDDFDKLPPEVQRNFYFCPRCGRFYHKEDLGECPCSGRALEDVSNIF